MDDQRTLRGDAEKLIAVATDGNAHFIQQIGVNAGLRMAGVLEGSILKDYIDRLLEGAPFRYFTSGRAAEERFPHCHGLHFTRPEKAKSRQLPNVLF